ncbi:MAG TPA: tripartite tricarboxylate transporter substrate binding protein [Burkholderiaceae bacterium]|nr:tripartite tricarboxylate transporter substrate binding protein [Burkholderiaceae bacterium]
MDKMIKRLMVGAVAFAAISLAGGAWATGNYPNGPIKMIVPFAAGGPTDALARSLADEMGNALKQQIIVENKPGAGGNVGTALAARAQPDGYTILITTNGPLVANPMLFKKITFDPKKDFAPVSLVTYLPNILAVHPSVPVKTTAELIELLKANPNKYSFASGGLGTSSHFSGELFKTMAGVQMVHVPYKGDGASMPDVVGGQVPIVFGSVFATSRYTQNNMLRPLAVTSKARVPSVPTVPSLDETGLKGYDLAAWYGILVPTGTPEPIVNKLSSTIATIIANPAFKQRIEGMGGIPQSMKPAEFRAFIDAERPKWEKLIKESGITID